MGQEAFKIMHEVNCRDKVSSVVIGSLWKARLVPQLLASVSVFAHSAITVDLLEHATLGKAIIESLGEMLLR